MALSVDTGATVKMTLHTDNDNEGGWGGTDGPDDYDVAIQGSNSESWQVSKNSTETGTLTKSSDISGTGNHFNLWMMSNLTQYLTSIKVQLISSTGNYREYTIATSSIQDVTGEFHCFALDIAGGTETGTFAPASFSSLKIEVNNSSSGNIRSVINNWIDAMYFGRGLTFKGASDSNDKMFAEATALDELTANKYGVLINVNEQLFAQGDVVFDDGGSTVTQKSNGENLVFTKKINTTNTYRLILLGNTNTVSFTNTNISATDTARFDFDSSGTINSFTMSGGSFKKASSIAFKTGQTISGVSFTECGEIDTNGATISSCNIISTIETTTGSLVINSSTELGNMSKLNFYDYHDNSRYAVYIPSSVTGTITLTDFVFDNPSSAYCLYWAGTGTLVVNRGGTTNLSNYTSPGTVTIQSSVSIDVHVEDQSTSDLQDAWVYIDTNPSIGDTADIVNTQTNSSGDVNTSYSGAASSAAIRIRKYGYKPYSGTISLLADSNTNVTLITDPQQT